MAAALADVPRATGAGDHAGASACAGRIGHCAAADCGDGVGHRAAAGRAGASRRAAIRCAGAGGVRFDRDLRVRQSPPDGQDEDWSLYDGVTLHPQPDGTAVEAPQLAAPITLADIVSLSDGGRRFRLCGRHADMLEIAGKRASLGDLTRRLLAIPGVRDGVVFQLDDGDALGVHRIAALVVAPGLDEHAILDALRGAIDPLFLPRPLRLVARCRATRPASCRARRCWSCCSRLSPGDRRG